MTVDDDHDNDNDVLDPFFFVFANFENKTVGFLLVRNKWRKTIHVVPLAKTT